MLKLGSGIKLIIKIKPYSPRIQSKRGNHVQIEP